MTARRAILRLIGFAAFGLMLNILIAWACALWSPMTTSNHPLALTRQEVGRWIDRSPWPYKLRPGHTVSSSSFGLQYDRLESGDAEPYFWRVARAVRAGFPLPALYGERWTNDTPGADPQHRNVFIAALRPAVLGLNGGPSTPQGSTGTRMLPWRPVLPGFITDTIFYAGLAWLLVATLRVLQRRTRLRTGRCPICAASLPSDDPATCPACHWIRGVTNAHRL